ncbi:hypothetical protein HELRODRAFT_78102 [Helobdella robusta]|uniref:General transcription factor IIF subunit 2 n=1 Tax=Helobdella robusta TaxID=6412 RepID=T1G378_HELRO|nr:hypothetical protein HELRODRAFT_78102 [Helobdella robusta]ESO05129.1 hypothetical protein HELRODRAFT_78102 [Helobdella robusta]
MHECKDLDLTKASRGIWLVKVPKYVSDSWANAAPGSEVGKLKMGSKSKGMKDAIFTINNLNSDKSGKPVPRDHQFNVKKNLGDINMSLLSVQMVPADSTNPNSPLIAAAIEGKVVHRCECRPCINETYMQMNRKRIEEGNKPERQIIQLTKAQNNYKPKANHEANIEYDLKKKEEGKKIRMDKERVMELLFNAFEKFQYYNVKDLVRITHQPVTYLKEILREMCTYNMKAPNRNTWELKPEFRHYKTQGQVASSSATSSVASSKK